MGKRRLEDMRALARSQKRRLRKADCCLFRGGPMERRKQHPDRISERYPMKKIHRAQRKYPVGMDGNRKVHIPAEKVRKP